ncbi:uncharacterized protein DFL_007564 [Arthrobotrys flagrans]|uniref:DUF7587 domain-containing protein n=1 Tax=Arthrobotrys flagrans TaxID=97331 RepID=A0A436ZWR1_ARTFL|nr:hypothetical protein DFL_007564 [Arthrobotrys flagrans]
MEQTREAAGSTIESNETSIIIGDHDLRMNTPEREELGSTASNENIGICEIAGPTPSTPKRPETLIQLQEEEEDEDLLRDLGNDQDDDSGYWTGRKRIRISVNKYKSRRPTLQSHEGDHLMFDRISPNSKYYKTIFVPSEKPVNRVLFPNTAKRENTTAKNQKQGKIQPEENNNLSDYPTEPEAQEELEPENIYDPLTPNLKFFKDIFIDTPFTDPEGKWNAVKEELMAAAESAGVDLVPRERDDDEVIKTYREGKKKQEILRARERLSAFLHTTPVKSPLFLTDDSSSSYDGNEAPDTPCKVPSKYSSESKKHKFMSLHDKAEIPTRNNGQRLALSTDILFRYSDGESFGYNSDTLVRAGFFRDISQPVPEPLEMNSPEFDKHAANHLNREKIPTPMISTSNSLMWVLRKAALSRRWISATYPRITIIDPRYLKKTYRASEFIKGLCKRQPMIPAAHRYGGHYDILVWAEIPKEAIINVIDYFELLHATSVPRHIHVHVRMDIVSRVKMNSVIYGMKFAVACSEEIERAVEDFSVIMLGEAVGTDLRDKFITNVSIDWRLGARRENQDVSKYFLPHWTATDAQQLLRLDAEVGTMDDQEGSGITRGQICGLAGIFGAESA